MHLKKDTGQKSVLKSFKRLPHRYEILGKKKGVVFINDSKSTNINSMEVALESIQKKFGKRKTLLICGGESKNQDFSKISKNSQSTELGIPS